MFRILKWLKRATLEDLSYFTLHRQLTDLNGHCIMFNFPCGGGAGEQNTFCLVFPHITVDRWGYQQGETL